MVEMKKTSRKYLSRVSPFIVVAFLINACLTQSFVPGESGKPPSPEKPNASHLAYIPLVIATSVSASLNPVDPTPTEPTPTQPTPTEPTPTQPTPTEPTATQPTATQPTATQPTITSTPTASTTPTTTQPHSGDGWIADHTVVDEFESIPQNFVEAASALKAFQRHASVGRIVSNQGLNYLQETRESSPYPDYQYDRTNWFWAYWDPWETTAKDKIDQFKEVVDLEHANYDVFAMKLCYVDWWMLDFNYYRDTMLDLESRYPAKTFIWWTTPVKNVWTDPPDHCEILRNYNTQVRAYARANGKLLLDLADIESHAPDGSVCYSGCETMCDEYRGDNGHPNQTGAIRIAKAYWWLMAKIAGW